MPGLELKAGEVATNSKRASSSKMALGKRGLSEDGAAAESGESAAIQVSNGGGSQLAKRSRVSEIVPVDQQVVTVKKVSDRTSDLAAPTMLLTGHSAAVYSLKFDPSGQHAASSSFDRSICTFSLQLYRMSAVCLM